MPTIARYSDELYHHGIKGQKWGVRRYQNEDGTLTPAGRERYGVSRSSHTITRRNLKDPESKAFVQRLMNETSNKDQQAFLAGVLAQGGKVEASINRPRLRDRDFTLNKDGSLRYYWGRSGNGKNATHVFITTPNNSEDWRFVNRMCCRTDSDKWTKDENKAFFAAASRLDDLTSRNHKNIDFLDGFYNKDQSNRRHKEINRNRALGVAGSMLALAGIGLTAKAISDYGGTKRAMARQEYERQNLQQQMDMARGADYADAVTRSMNAANGVGSTTSRSSSSSQSYRKGSIGDPNRYTKSGKVKRKYRNKRGE